jgi:hypothetical protein
MKTMLSFKSNVSVVVLGSDTVPDSLDQKYDFEPVTGHQKDSLIPP